MGNRIKIALALLAAAVIVAGGFIVWAVTGPDAQPEALAAIRSDDAVAVVTEPWLAFFPQGTEPRTGLIFYPGGRVDYRAYSPPARAVAAEGYLVVIVPMPLDLAVLNLNEAADVIEAYPEIAQWAIGGHSLGGAMAASYADNHREEIDGLVLWAAYPAESNDLSGAQLEVVSIYGTRDGLATGDKIEASRPLLPADTRWVEIEGGNHAQFGRYGPQSGDNAATVSREVQQEAVVQATVDLLASLEE